MGNHPSQYPGYERPVTTVPQPVNPEPVSGFKQRPAPKPPQRVPSYKNPHCLVLPREAPTGILKSRNGPALPAEDYFTDEDAESELDEPDEEFERKSTASRTQGLYPPLKQGNYTPNGEIIVKERARSQSLDFEDTRRPRTERPKSTSVLNPGKIPVPQDVSNSNYDRFMEKRIATRNGSVNGSISSDRNFENRVTFAAGTNHEPALGTVVRPLQRRQKARAPPPPRPPPPASEPAPPPAPVPPPVLPFREPPSREVQKRVNQKRLTEPRPSLHEQLQEDIKKAAIARQSRELVQPPKIEKPKSGEEMFKDELIKVCKRIETYQAEDTDVEGPPGRDSEWETTYDPTDYKPKTTSKFLVKQNSNFTRAQQNVEQKKSVVPSVHVSVQQPSPVVQKSIPPAPPRKPVQRNASPPPRRSRSDSVDSVLGGTINIIPTKAEEESWSPSQVLMEDDDDATYAQVRATNSDSRNSGTIFGPGVMRMNTQEASIGSVRMYRGKSVDSSKPSRYSNNPKHRHSDGSVRSKSSMRSLKNSIRSALSSIGAKAKSQKERTSVKGYFDQADYRYGPDFHPVMFYHPQDPYYQNYYPMHYRAPQPISPTMPYPYYDDPYRMYPSRPMPMQPFMMTDGSRRAMSMDELQYEHFRQMYFDPRQARPLERPNKASRETRGSWSSLKDVADDGGSIGRSWRRLKAKTRSRTKSRESIENWPSVDNRQLSVDDSSDDEESVAMPLASEYSRQEASRKYQESMQRGSRRRAHGKKNGGISSSSDENKPPTKLLREDGLPPTGQKLRNNRYRKKTNEED